MSFGGKYKSMPTSGDQGKVIICFLMKKKGEEDFHCGHMESGESVCKKSKGRSSSVAALVSAYLCNFVS